MPATADTAPRLAIEPEVFLQRWRQILEQHDEVEDAKDAEKALLASASSNGVNIKAVKLVRKVMKMDPREAQSYLRDTLLYLRWLGLNPLDQEVMFEIQTSDLTDQVMSSHKQWAADRDAMEAGFKAGKNGEPIDNNPYHAAQASSQHQVWAKNWRDGNEEYIAAKGGTVIRPPAPGEREDEDDEDAA